MATRASSPRRLVGEPRFFFLHAAALTLVALLGFGSAAVAARPSYLGLAWPLYLHALIFVAWCALAMAQPWLIAERERALHRRLGWAGGALALAMAVSGTLATNAGVAAGRLAPPAIWLAMNGITVASFAALIGGGITVRRTTDWHRRLLASATTVVTAPAWPRLLATAGIPPESLGPLTLPVITMLVLAFIAWGMIHDRRTRGRIHPAWWWGGALAAAPGVLTVPLAMVPAFARWADGFAPA